MPVVISHVTILGVLNAHFVNKLTDDPSGENLIDFDVGGFSLGLGHWERCKKLTGVHFVDQKLFARHERPGSYLQD